MRSDGAVDGLIAEENDVVAGEIITLDCPSCRAEIARPLSWFKKTYATCPHCGGGLAAAQFAEQLAVIEEAFDAAIDDMVRGAPTSGGCCREKR